VHTQNQHRHRLNRCNFWLRTFRTTSLGTTYNSLEEYGDEFKPKTLEKANHALVLMIQGLADRLHQPIAMFASKGPVKGNYKCLCFSLQFV